MGGFDSMSNGDLILCVNLLQADAREYEQMTNDPELKAILGERATDRRALASRMHAEVRRRGEAQFAPQEKV